MKTLFTVSLVMGALVMYGQSIDVGVGYQYGMPGILGESTFEADDVSSTEVICGSLGTGLSANLNVNFPLTSYLDVGIGANFTKGFKQMTDQYEYQFTSNSIVSTDYAAFTRLDLTPHVTLRTSIEDGMGMYARGGFMLPVFSGITWTGEGGSGSFAYSYEERSWDRFSIGYFSEIGATFSLSDNIDIGVGLFGTKMSGKKAKGEYLSYMQDGEEQIDTWEVYDREINYVKMLDRNSNNLGYNDEVDFDAPRDNLQTSNNYSAFGGVIRTTFRF